MTDAPQNHDAGAVDEQAAPDNDGAAADEQAAPSSDAGAADDRTPSGDDGSDDEQHAGDAGRRDEQPDGAAVDTEVDPAAADVLAALHQATQERDTYLDHLRRERAEFENFRRRSQKERMEALDRGAEALIAELLAVLDNFGYVLEAAKDADDAVAKGVRMVHAELRGILERAGLEDVPGVGQPFDPTWHDAVMQVDGETTDDGEPTVAQVLRSGYRFKGRVLRPASVAVTQ